MSKTASSLASAWQRSSTRRFLRWLFTWRVLRVFLFGAVLLATLTGLAYALENARGKRAWQKYQKEIAAKGERLELAAFVPPPVPDEQNFAATPLITYAFTAPAGEKLDPRWPDLARKIEQEAKQYQVGTRNKAHRRLTDVAALQKGLHKLRHTNQVAQFTATNAAAELLAALQIYEPILAELREAAKRPLAQYPVNYEVEDPWSILLPHLQVIRPVCSLLKLRSAVALAAGESPVPFEDVKLILRFADSLRDEPFLITYLVRSALLQMAINSLWEGLAQSSWSETQLLQFEEWLRGQDFIRDLRKPMRAEQAAATVFIDMLKHKKHKVAYLRAVQGDDDGPFSSTVLLAGLAPRGWFYLEQVNYLRIFQEIILPMLDQEHATPQEIDKVHAKVEERIVRPFNGVFHHVSMARLLLPAITNVRRKATQTQTAVHQAIIACALERFRISKGRYPEKLEELVPVFVKQLPPDLIKGGSFVYRSRTNGFTLYSVGWNTRDDGGLPGKTQWDNKGDWVWKSDP